MENKVVVITGATSGIGQIAAEQLAAMGAKIVQVARDRARGEMALDRLRKAGPNAAHTIHYADMSRLSEMKRVAVEVAAAEPRIDVLINNAGAIFRTRELTTDGLERTFALNQMAYFVFTLGLLERIKASAPARIVNTSSAAHKSGMLDLDDLQSAKTKGGGIGGIGYKLYAKSKLCNILFTRELAKRLKGSGVTANCLHPGLVATRFADETGGFLTFLMGMAKRHVAISVEEGAKTIVYLATSPEVADVTGGYFYQCHAESPTPTAQDDAAAARLWQESAALASLGQ